MATVKKVNWLGGMNSLLDPSKVSIEQGYWLGVNIRTRRNTAASVRAPLDITAGLPSGVNIQGLYAFDRSLLVFAAGQAYYKVDSAGPWIHIAGLNMSASVAEIDVEAIPASTVNFVRSASTSTTQADNEVVLGNPLPASPQALIVMDGVTQPALIFPDATTRVTQNYAQWTSTNAEYVPIARFPRYSDGILYCVGRDLAGNFTQIYRSVSGKPCDFVILLKANGDKISGLENEGGAPQLATRVSYAPTTALTIANVGASALISSTANGTWAVIPDYDNLIAAEPTFSHIQLMDVGATGKNSFVEVLGDTTVICRAGVRSFNGVRSLKWEGKNAPFSAAVNNFISASEQTVTAAGVFDNYALYALSTIAGPGVLVYDMIQQAWVSIDIYAGVKLIKQFATVQSGTTEQLFFYTEDNKIYQAFAGGVQKSQVFLHELTPANPSFSHSFNSINGVFSNVRSAGFAEAYGYIDRVEFNPGAQALPVSGEVFFQPTDLPFNTPQTQAQCVPLDFSFLPHTQIGWRAMAGMAWNADAELLEMALDMKQVFADVKAADAGQTIVQRYVFLHTANDFGSGDNRVALHELMVSQQFDRVFGSGNHAPAPGDYQDVYGSVEFFWGGLHKQDRFLATAGSNELGTSNGLPFYNFVRQGPTHYSKFSFAPALDVFFLSIRADLWTAQWEWLEQEAANSTAAFKIVCIAKGPASSVVTNGGIYDAADYKALGINAVLTADGNIYERCVLPDGLTVINNGVGGGVAIPANVPSVLNTHSKRAIPALGFVQLIATPLRLTINFVDHATKYVVDSTNL